MEGRFNGEFFALPVWGAYIWRGLYREGLIFGILRYLRERVLYDNRENFLNFGWGSNYPRLGVVKSECKFLYGYLEESTERMLQMALKEKVLFDETNPQDYQKKEEKVKNWKEKALHGEFARQTSGGWRGVLETFKELFYKKGTELILAA